MEASNGAVLQLRWDPKANVRPWDKALWIKVVKGFLQPGDRITIRLGVTEFGGPGLRLQTFCEETFEFRLLVDPIATFNFQPLPVQPMIAIVPGPPERFVAVLPSHRRPGETFALKVKGEDKWGNPSDRCAGRLRLHASGPVEGLPAGLTLTEGAFAHVVEGLVAAAPGRIDIWLTDEAGERAARATPLIVSETPLSEFWADLHGQSEETIGTGSARGYFAFARDKAFVDACGHQGNDFQITDEFWAELNRITAEFDAPGKFVAMPGYEWSGNTALGGDRNVFFPEEGRVIRRSSHALIEDQSTADTDCFTAGALFEAFAANGEFDVVCYAHCGGRYADIGFAHDGRFERSVEVHSSWGTFEWLLEDAFRLGYRVGVVCNSDGHKGRPGASYAGAGKFGAIGGLTCFHAERLDRASLLDCMRKRRHFGTSGGPTGRMSIDLRASFDSPGTLFHDDPALFETAGAPANEAMMGDIVRLSAGEVALSIAVEAAAPILRIDLFNGLEHLETIRPYAETDLGRRIRLHWEGAEYRGRFREVIWDGAAHIEGNRILAARPINFFNRDKVLDLTGPQDLAWKALTTGNFGGGDLMLEDAAAGRLRIDTPLVKAEVPVGEIGFDDMVFDNSGELPRFLKLTRLPDENPHLSMKIERRVPLRAEGDNPLYIRVELEDGTRAWTSPIYLFRG